MGVKDTSKYVTFRYFMDDGYPAGVNHTCVWSKTRKLTRSRTGVAVPNWWQKIANSENATSNLSGTFISLVSSTPLDGFCEFRGSQFAPWIHTSILGHVAGYNWTPDVNWSDFSSGADARATANFIRSVREAEIKVSGPVFLGELAETLRMLRSPAKGLQELIISYLSKAQSLKKGKGRGGSKKFSDALSKLWLEYSFGWIPLMHDIEDAKKAYISLFEKDRLIKVSGGGKDFKRLTNTLDNTWALDHGQGLIGLQNTNLVDQTEIVRFRGVVGAQAATTSRAQFKRFGFTPSEFVPAAWELLPWSFLVDYFSNIGSILEASVTDLAQVRWLSKSTIRQLDIQGFVKFGNNGLHPSNIKSLRSNQGMVHYRKRTINRVANAGISLPTLTFRLPHSDSKLLNIAALLEQARRRIHHQNPRGNSGFSSL